MSLLKPLGSGQGYLKAGVLGWQGSGKTFTSINVAIGLRDYFKLDGPIAMFDTEGGSEYIAELVHKATGKPLVGTRSHALDDLLETARECEREGVSVLVVDSISHVWKEICDAHLKAVNESLKRRGKNPRFKLELVDWNPIKTRWAEWTTLYLNSKLHVIVCGRAGNVWEHVENEETGKKELQAVGTKMKAEGEFGYEPSLLIEMERVENRRKRSKSTIGHQATVTKDRFNQINGHVFQNPTFKNFLPHIGRLRPGAYAPVDTEPKSVALVDEDGRDYGRAKEIFLDEIKEELVRKWPSTSNADKAAKASLLEDVFETRSWKRVESLSLTKLKIGLEAIRRVTLGEEIPEIDEDDIPFANGSSKEDQPSV